MKVKSIGSFSLWCETNIDDKQIGAELHFNLWTSYKNEKNKEDAPVLDIGIMIDSIQNVKKIKLFIPYKNIEEKEISDLGSKLVKDDDLLNAVFNESYTLRTNVDSKIVEVHREKDKAFIIYTLDIGNKDIEVEGGYDGSIVTININSSLNQEDGKVYLRYRIKSKVLNQMIQHCIPKNNGLQSAFAMKYFIDFRFYDKRSLKKSLLEKMNEKNNKIVNVEKIHFLLMTKADIDILSTEFHNERQLENDIWKNYIDDKVNPLLIANHWKLENRQDGIRQQLVNANIYIKYVENKCNWKTIGIYLIILLGITVIFNTISTVFFDELKNLLSMICPR